MSSHDDYVSRLENVLDLSTDANELRSAMVNVPAYPKIRELQLELSSNELSIREFLSMRECKLHTTIAKRNSLMGKVAKRSQLLYNDIRLLAEGPSCLATLSDPRLSQKLTNFLDKKQSQLDQSLWLGLLAQTEHAQFWRVRGDYIDTKTVSSLDALATFVKRVRAGNLNISEQEFNQVEKNLGELRFANGGEILRQYAQLLNAMSRANSLVRQSLNLPLCFGGSTTTKARYLNNVVTKYFISKVQRESVELNRLSETIMNSHAKLESQLMPSANKAYIQWAKEREALIERGRSATTSHALLLQELYRQCGLEVGVNHSADQI